MKKAKPSKRQPKPSRTTKPAKKISADECPTCAVPAGAEASLDAWIYPPRPSN